MTTLYVLHVLAAVLAAAQAFICPESDGHFQHETRCDKYYWCVASVPHLTGCPPGSFFSTVTNFCNWPYAVSQCSDDGARTDVSGGWVEPHPQPPAHPPHGQDQHLNSWEQDSGNRWNSQDSWDQPHWDSYMMKAIKGAMKSEKKHRVRREAEPVQAVAYQGYSCDGDDGYYRHDTDCTLYWRCINHVPHLQKCTGLYFDPIIERCSWPHTVHDCSENGKVF